jgi:hypothetical protein
MPAVNHRWHLCPMLKVRIKRYAFVFFSLLMAWILVHKRMHNVFESIQDRAVDAEGASVQFDSDRLTLVIVFSPFDCWICLREIPVWKRLEKDFEGQLDIIGIVRAPNMILVRRTVSQNGITFRVIGDSNYILSRRLLGPTMFPKRFFLRNAKVIREDMVGIEPGSLDEEELTEWIQNELRNSK